MLSVLNQTPPPTPNYLTRVIPWGAWSYRGQSRANYITIPAMTRTHRRIFPLKTQGKRFQSVTPQNIDPGLLQELDLTVTEEEELDFVFPLDPEDLGQGDSPDELEGLD